jgi:hypothetical protein
MKGRELEKRRENKERAGKELEAGLVQHRELEQHRQHNLQQKRDTDKKHRKLALKFEQSGVQIHPEATARITLEAAEAEQIASCTEQQAQVINNYTNRFSLTMLRS